MSVVYVLTTLIESEQRPIAVITDERAADEWSRQGDNNDWILFELDDLSLTGMGSAAPFKPTPPPKAAPGSDVFRDTIEIQKKSIAQLQGLVETLMKKVEELQGKKKRSAFKNPLLQKETE